MWWYSRAESRVAPALGFPGTVWKNPGQQFLA
jgi:hypothetical protein